MSPKREEPTSLAVPLGVGVGHNHRDIAQQFGMALIVVAGAGSDILGAIMTDAPTLGASPIQARSLNRVQNILDAAASIIDRDGVDALTPTEIAYLSGSSVPSVYRYFPNTRSLLHTLATRNLERFLSRVEMGSDLASDNPWSSLHNTLSVFEDMYRSEPSFRSLRFGDGIDASFLTSDEPNMTVIAKALSAMFAETHGVDMTPGMLHHIEVATTTHSALVDLAFHKDRNGDTELLARAMELTLEYLPKHVPLT